MGGSKELFALFIDVLRVKYTKLSFGLNKSSNICWHHDACKKNSVVFYPDFRKSTILSGNVRKLSVKSGYEKNRSSGFSGIFGQWKPMWYGHGQTITRTSDFAIYTLKTFRRVLLGPKMKFTLFMQLLYDCQ